MNSQKTDTRKKVHWHSFCKNYTEGYLKCGNCIYGNDEDTIADIKKNDVFSSLNIDNFENNNMLINI